MIARAPGKVIVSGAYAVLHGAPAIVTAVDRFVIADSDRTTEFVAPEVRAALGDVPAPFFDASALRSGSRKLGLGSSAAILVASLAARNPTWLATAAGKHQLLATALAAHRRAQGGGSGVDVLASVLGGTLVARRSDLDTLNHRAILLPDALHIEVWSCPTAAETRTLVGKVAQLAARDRARHDAWIDTLTAAAERAVQAVDDQDAAAFIAALQAQAQGLAGLGAAAGAPIVTPELDQLMARGADPRVAILPAGAGGGDIALYVGLIPPTGEIVALARSLTHAPLSLRLGAVGAHLDDTTV